MPIYEFKCTNCGATFDRLCRLQWEGSARCPACGDNKPQKLISQFSGAGLSGSLECGSCSSMNCGSCK